MNIENVHDLMESLREGRYTSLGSYPKFYLCHDGGVLSHDAVMENLFLIGRSIRDKDNNGWRIVGVYVNYEDGELFCSHSGEKIPAAYL